jgi:spermidine synthase
VLSGGAGGVLHELLKYPLERIDYAELDPLLIEAILQHPTPLTAGELGDPRLHVQRVDGRLLVRQRQSEIAGCPQERYDLILVNLPYPSTLQLNRFYTVEFYAMVRDLLAEDGVLVTGYPGALSYVGGELRDLNTSLYHTLQHVYPHVWPIPGDQTLWLASSSAELTETVEGKRSLEGFVTRWEARSLEARLLTPDHIRYKLDERRRDWFWASLDRRTYSVCGEGTLGGARKWVNRDLRPVGLLYGLAYWNALYSPGLSRAYARVGRLTLRGAILPLVGCGIVTLALVWRTERAKIAVVPIAVATNGFAGMAADLLVVLAFQTLYGHVYGWIGSLIAAFMGGIGLGGLLVTRRLARGKRVSMLWIEGALVLYWALLPAILGVLHSTRDQPWTLAFAQGALLALNGIAGTLVGAQFPLANALWPGGISSRRAHFALGASARSPRPRGRSAGQQRCTTMHLDRPRGRGLEQCKTRPQRETDISRPGLLYACDLVGACTGAIVVSVVLVPALGILATCLLVAILKVASLTLVAVSST